jgi:hypothetical protein
MEEVSFIHTERGDDLIVSFAILSPEPMEVKSLTLLRTPKYEFILDADERGVTVSLDDFPDEDRDLLRALAIWDGKIEIVTEQHRYLLNVRKVDEEDMQEAQQVLKRMNFDQRFELQIV